MPTHPIFDEPRAKRLTPDFGIHLYDDFFWYKWAFYISVGIYFAFFHKSSVTPVTEVFTQSFYKVCFDRTVSGFLGGPVTVSAVK